MSDTEECYNRDGGWASIVAGSVANIVIVVARRLCVVFDRIKTRAGRVGAYLKAIATCVINFDKCNQFSDNCNQFSDTC